MSEHMSPIPSRLYNAAVGGHVAGADQIIDDETGLTLDKVAGGALEEKEYTSDSNDGMGRVVLRKNLVEGVNTLTQSMINKSNTIYIIQYDFTLASDVSIPANCVLEFDGGSINGNKTLTGNNTGINAGLVKIFNTDVTLAGTWNIINVYPEWFGAKGVDNDTAAIKKALVLGAGHTVVFSRSRTYKLHDYVEVFSNTEIIVDGVIDNTSYGCFELFSRTTEQPGYTGVTNVYIHGYGIFNCNGHLDVEGSIGIATPFRVHHCTNIIIEGITVKNFKVHCIEIGGSKNIIIKNMKFLGNVYSNAYGGGEAIQLERVTKDGCIGAIPYDYTITKDITIDSCVFGKSDDSSSFIKAIGSHDNIQDSDRHDENTFSNITISNCVIKDLDNMPTNEYLIKLDSNYKNVCIKNNTFDNIFESILYIGSYSENIIIEENTFRDLELAAIYLRADYDVTIKGNKFIRCQKHSSSTHDGAVMWNDVPIKNYRIMDNFAEISNEYNSKIFHIPSVSTSPSVIFKDNQIANVSILNTNKRKDFYEQLGRFEYRSESAPMGRNYTLYYTDMPSITTKGTTANRPKAWSASGEGGILSKTNNLCIGFMYFDTDLGKPIYVKDIDSNDNVVWVDATGAIV